MKTQDLTNLLVVLLSEKAEQPWLEFKLNVGSHGSSITLSGIGEYISALANGACISRKDFGYLIFGIEDTTHKVVGTNFKPSETRVGNQDFELWLRMMLSPKLNFDFFHITHQNVPVVVLQIKAASGEPVNFQDKAYIRINSQKTLLKNHPNFIRQIYNLQEDWSAKIIAEASLSDLDEAALKFARQKFKDKSINESFHGEIDSWTETIFLDKAKLTKNGNQTATSILLLGKSESIHFLSPHMGEITWKLNSEQKAYEHFGLPFFLNTTKVLQRIRNYQYKFFPDSELLAVTVNKYETRVILEALHNAIAHQDYTLMSRIIVTEESEKIVFQNAGDFFTGSPDEYSIGEKTPDKYRNPWLVKAMVNLGMIDTVGHGIHTMVIEQRNRFFPLPDYSKSDFSKVILEIYGQELDINYSKLLIKKSNLDLETVILLDKVQKRIPISRNDVVFLRKQDLIEGRAPNVYISEIIARDSGKLGEYIKNKGFDDRYFKDLILAFIKSNNQATKKEIDHLFLDKLPDVLDRLKRRNKIKNLIYSLSKIEQLIENEGTMRYPVWKLSNKS